MNYFSSLPSMQLLNDMNTQYSTWITWIFSYRIYGCFLHSDLRCKLRLPPIRFILGLFYLSAWFLFLFLSLPFYPSRSISNCKFDKIAVLSTTRPLQRVISTMTEVSQHSFPITLRFALRRSGRSGTLHVYFISPVLSRGRSTDPSGQKDICWLILTAFPHPRHLILWILSLYVTTPTILLSSPLPINHHVQSRAWWVVGWPIWISRMVASKPSPRYHPT